MEDSVKPMARYSGSPYNVEDDHPFRADNVAVPPSLPALRARGEEGDGVTVQRFTLYVQPVIPPRGPRQTTQGGPKVGYWRHFTGTSEDLDKFLDDLGAAFVTVYPLTPGA